MKMSELDLDRDTNYPAEGSWEEGQTNVLENLEQSPPEEKKEEELQPLVIEQAQVNFKAERSTSGPTDPAEEVLMSFILENPKTFNAVMERYGKVMDGLTKGDMSTNPSDRSWMAALVSGMQHINLESTPIGGTEREGSEWTQGVRALDGTTLMRSGRPSQRLEKGRRHSKEEVIAYLTKKSGLGSTYEAFMPGSGIWLRLRSPDTTEIIALQTELQQIKVRVGTETKGMAFSSAGAVMSDAVTKLALNCVIGSNKSYMTPADLEQDLTIFDEMLLHHALATTMFADGFKYSVPCIADPASCSARIEAKLNMSAIVWFDNTIFNNDQRKFIAKKFAQATDDEFKAYREGFVIGSKKVFWFGDVGVRLAVPTIAQRRGATNQWIATLIEMSQGAFNEPPHGNNRAAYIDKLTKTTIAKQYAHWVDAIYEKIEEVEDFEDQFVSDDEEIISSYLASVLSAPEYATDFFEAVHKYTNETVPAVVALPSHNCKECNTKQGESFNERFPHLVPLDTLAIFFTLAGRKVAHLEL